MFKRPKCPNKFIDRVYIAFQAVADGAKYLEEGGKQMLIACTD